MNCDTLDKFDELLFNVFNDKYSLNTKMIKYQGLTLET